MGVLISVLISEISGRRQWVEDRLLELAEIFSVGVYAYAVMSNHVHVVMHADPLRPDQWPDEEVV